MRLTSTTLALVTLLFSYTSATSISKGTTNGPEASCTLTASGGDDAPQFLSAVASCPTVTIPKSTTLNIATRLNMTGLTNKHIVRGFRVYNCSLLVSYIFVPSRVFKAQSSSVQIYRTGLGYVPSFLRLRLICS